MDELIAIGKIVRVHGVKGELVVVPLTDFVDRFEDLESAVLEGRNNERHKVSSVRFHKSNVLIKFEGIDSRDEAELHVGDFVSVCRDELVELPKDIFFQFDIVGMRVYSDAGEFLGEIAEIIEMPANDLWRIEGPKSLVIPAAESFIVSVDPNERKVVVRLLPGLDEIQP